MKYALPVQVDPGQEVGLGALTVVVVEDLGHKDTLQGLLDPFWKDFWKKLYLKFGETRQTSHLVLHIRGLLQPTASAALQVSASSYQMKISALLPL